jgi:hypothetical protein
MVEEMERPQDNMPNLSIEDLHRFIKPQTECNTCSINFTFRLVFDYFSSLRKFIFRSVMVNSLHAYLHHAAHDQISLTGN